MKNIIHTALSICLLCLVNCSNNNNNQPKVKTEISEEIRIIKYLDLQKPIFSTIPNDNFQISITGMYYRKDKITINNKIKENEEFRVTFGHKCINSEIQVFEYDNRNITECTYTDGWVKNKTYLTPKFLNAIRNGGMQINKNDLNGHKLRELSEEFDLPPSKKFIFDKITGYIDADIYDTIIIDTKQINNEIKKGEILFKGNLTNNNQFEISFFKLENFKFYFVWNNFKAWQTYGDYVKIEILNQNHEEIGSSNLIGSMSYKNNFKICCKIYRRKDFDKHNYIIRLNYFYNLRKERINFNFKNIKWEE